MVIEEASSLRAAWLFDDHLLGKWSGITNYTEPQWRNNHNDNGKSSEPAVAEQHPLVFSITSCLFPTMTFLTPVWLWQLPSRS